MNYASIRRVRYWTRQTKDALRSLVADASVPTLSARLDYCNVMLAGTADIVIKRLQSVQNTAARLRLVSETVTQYH